MVKDELLIEGGEGEREGEGGRRGREGGRGAKENEEEISQ